MDYLDEQEAKGQKKECLDRLKHRKQDLMDRLGKLCNQKFEVEKFNKVLSDEQQDITECKEILDTYRLHGVCIKSMGPDLVLRFDPLYRNQYPNTEHYSVQLLKKGYTCKLGKHNLPPFIPANKLLEKCPDNGIEEFVEEIRQLLYAYVQRRESLKQAKIVDVLSKVSCTIIMVLLKDKTFEENFQNEIEVDLAVSYSKYQLLTSDDFPPIEITMQYSLEKCLPDTVEMSIVTDDDNYSVSKKMIERSINKWRQILLEKDILTALSEIVGI